jgi:hypothetical protein
MRRKGFKMAYYVTVIDGSKYRPLAGPYDAHSDALEALPVAKGIAQAIDPKARFYAFGTSKIENYSEKGILQKLGKM